ncbi:tubulin-like doman-containing protein [Arachnia propionica]|nr:tubulin-like doman-containing protein [Arachnia propionica]
MANMHPILFLGLGGTGGKVLGVIQNTLARRLRGVGVDEIPDGIQFLHIDVPAQRDAEEGGYAFGLSPDDYHALTVANSSYNTAHRDFHRALGPGSDAARSFERWAPRPGSVSDASGEGAHQMRAYGRVVALDQLPQISRAIHARLVTCVQGRDQLNPAATALGQAGLGQPIQKPLVIVIGSLTGGSGAGLVGDVLDVLHSLEGVLPHSAITTLFSPDVHAGNGAGSPGLAPNALAAVCELIAQDYSPGVGRTETGYQPTRDAIFNAKNLPNAPSSGTEAYFLVGASSQRGTVFTRPQDVYRVVGSMYADLAMNPNLLGSFVAYTLTNYDSAKQHATDHLGLTSENSYDNPNLMGLGFGQLSIGRSFFAQYAHERLMRLMADQLLEAHLNVPATDRGKSNEVLLDQAIHTHYEKFVQSLQLNERDTRNVQNDDIHHQVTIRDTPAYENLLHDFGLRLQQHIEQHGRGNHVSTETAYEQAHTDALLEMREAEPGSSYTPLRELARQLFHENLEQFEHDLQARLLNQIPAAIAAYGFPVVLGMLRMLREHLVEAAHQLSSQALDAERDAASHLQHLQHGRPGMSRRIRKDSQELSDILEDAKDPIIWLVHGDELRATSSLVADLLQGTIDPWIAAIQSSLDGLRNRVDSPLPGGGTLRTTWPSATEGVPHHLRPSAVEFTLEDVEEFPQEFLRQVTARMPGTDEDLATQLASTEQIQQRALDDAIRDLITGKRDDLNTGRRIEWTDLPVAQQAENWVSKLRDRAKARSAVIRLAFTAEDLDDRVVDWLNDPNSGTRQYLDCTLREYLNPPANSVTDEEIRRRHDTMVTEFEKLMAAAVPLVQLNEALFSQVHGGRPETGLILDAVDVPALDQAIQNRLGTQPLPQRLKAVVARFFPNQPLSTEGTPSPSITLLSSTAAPFHLLVAGSILGPAANSGDATSERGWRNRRSRPLPEYLPLAIETQKRLLQGLFIGRLTGQVEMDRRRPELLRVRLEDGRWMEVPLHGLRLRHSQFPQRDYPGRFLESLIPALVEAHRRSDLTPLHPYQHLHRLGVSHTRYPFPMAEWIERGGEFPQTNDVFRLSAADNVEARRKQVEKALTELRDSFDHLARLGEDVSPELLPTLEIIGIAHEAIDELLRHATVVEERF